MFNPFLTIGCMFDSLGGEITQLYIVIRFLKVFKTVVQPNYFTHI